MNRVASLILACVVALGLTAGASAGGRHSCYNRYCTTCYPQQTYQKKTWGWRDAAAVIEKQQIETDAFLAWQQRQANYAQPAGVVANGVPGYGGAYSAQISGAVSSYPVPGTTAYFATGTNPVVQSAAQQQAYQRFLGMMIQGTHQGMMDQADLAKIEADGNREIVKMQKIAESYERMARASEPKGEFRKLDFTMQIDESTGQVSIQPQQPTDPLAELQPGANAFDALKAAKCASCHSGQNAQGGLDLTGEIPKDALGASVQAIREGRMPKAKDAQGNFVDGEDLSLEELALFVEAWRAAK